MSPTLVVCMDHHSRTSPFVSFDLALNQLLSILLDMRQVVALCLGKIVVDLAYVAAEASCWEPTAEPNATHSVQESPKEQQNNELARSAKRLYGLANSAAQALAAIPYLHTSTSDAQVMRDLVQKIYALAAITSSFLESLMVESMTGGEDHKDMWSKDHHLRLLNSTERCREVFAAIGHAVRIADEHFQVTGVGKGENYLDSFKLDNQQQAQITIDECYGLVSQTNVIAKHTALARIENL